MLTNIFDQPESELSQMLLRELKEQGSQAAAVECPHHDLAYYAPRESDISNKLRKKFVIQLRFDGSVKKARVKR